MLSESCVEEMTFATRNDESALTDRPSSAAIRGRQVQSSGGYSVDSRLARVIVLVEEPPILPGVVAGRPCARLGRGSAIRVAAATNS